MIESTEAPGPYTISDLPIFFSFVDDKINMKSLWKSIVLLSLPLYSGAADLTEADVPPSKAPDFKLLRNDCATPHMENCVKMLHARMEWTKSQQQAARYSADADLKCTLNNAKEKTNGTDNLTKAQTIYHSGIKSYVLENSILRVNLSQLRVEINVSQNIHQSGCKTPPIPQVCGQLAKAVDAATKFYHGRYPYVQIESQKIAAMSKAEQALGEDATRMRSVDQGPAKRNQRNECERICADKCSTQQINALLFDMTKWDSCMDPCAAACGVKFNTGD